SRSITGGSKATVFSFGTYVYEVNKVARTKSKSEFRIYVYFFLINWIYAKRMGSHHLKLLTLQDGQLGVNEDEVIIVVDKALQAVPEAGLTADIMDVISSGKEGLEKLESYIKRLDLTDADFLLDEKDVAWGPAVSRPRKIICVGLNYRKHADETK